MAKMQKKAAKKAVTVRKSKARTKKKAAVPAATQETGLWRPLVELRDQIEDMLQRHMQGWPTRWPMFEPWSGMEPSLKGFMRTPSLDMSESDKGYEITAELPGMDEKDLDVNVSDDVLTISGEKKDEREEEKKDYYVKERRYGHFHRSLRLPQDADLEKISAEFKKGVLTVAIPKAGGAKKRARKISVR